MSPFTSVYSVSNMSPLLSLQVHPEGKFVVDVDKNIDINDVSATDSFHHVFL